jgi:hypothetical protein
LTKISVTAVVPDQKRSFEIAWSGTQMNAVLLAGSTASRPDVFESVNDSLEGLDALLTTEKLHTCKTNAVCAEMRKQ